MVHTGWRGVLSRFSCGLKQGEKEKHGWKRKDKRRQSHKLHHISCHLLDAALPHQHTPSRGCNNDHHYRTHRARQHQECACFWELPHRCECSPAAFLTTADISCCTACSSPFTRRDALKWHARPAGWLHSKRGCSLPHTIASHRASFSRRTGCAVWSRVA